MFQERRKRAFFIQNERRIQSWVQRRKNGEWFDRKVTQEIECGGGKSSLIPFWAYTLKKMDVIDKVCWVVPRLTLAEQAAEVFEEGHWNWSQFGVPPTEAAHYAIRYMSDGNEVNPSKGLFGYAISYNSIAADIDLHMQEFQRCRYLLVLDEIQFARLEKTFGIRIEELARYAAFILVVSGDFDTNSSDRVAVVDYVASTNADDDRLYVNTDYRYEYLDALNDNAVLPIDFNYADGAVSYFNVKNDELYEYSSLREVEWEQQMPSLRAILKTEYARELLNACTLDWHVFRHEGITREGRFYPPFTQAQMLIVAGNIAAARDTYESLTDPYGEWAFSPDEVVLVTSADEDPKGKLAAFKKNQPYNGASVPVRIAITVAMAYVGMDAPDISHICVLTFYRSAPWIHQMLARAWRLYQMLHNIPYDKQYCVAFVPPDRRLDEIIAKIRDSIRVGWREPKENSGDGGGGEPDTTIVEYGKLIEQWRKFALDPESMRARARDLGYDKDLIDLEKLRDVLMVQGLPGDVVAEMMAVATMRLSNTPKTRNPQEQYEYDRSKLEQYQAETVNQLMILFGWPYQTEKDKWQATKIYVSARLKENFNGRAVKELDADEMSRALDNVAPRLRQWCVNNKAHVLEKIMSIQKSVGGKRRAA